MRRFEVVIEVNLESANLRDTAERTSPESDLDMFTGTDSQPRNVSSNFNTNAIWLGRETGEIPEYPSSVTNDKVGGDNWDGSKLLAQSEPDIMNARCHAIVGNWGASVSVQAMEVVGDNEFRPFEGLLRINLGTHGNSINGEIINTRSVYFRGSPVTISPPVDGGRVVITHIEVITKMSLNKHTASNVEWSETISNTDGTDEFGIYTDSLHVDFGHSISFIKHIDQEMLYNTPQIVRVIDEQGNTVSEQTFLFDKLKNRDDTLTRFRITMNDEMHLTQYRTVGSVSVPMQRTARPFSFWLDHIFFDAPFELHNIAQQEINNITIVDGYSEPVRQWDAILFICEILRCNCSFKEGRYMLWRI